MLVPAGGAMGLRLLGEGCHRLVSPVVRDERPDSENYAWFDSGGSSSGVSNTGEDFALIAVQESADSSMELLKQAMLHHEDMFRNQVFELHRLYWTQKNLMDDPCWRDFDENVVSMDDQTPNWGTKMDSMMNSTLAKGVSIFQEYAVHHSRQGIFDLQLPLEVHTDNADSERLRTQISLHHKACGDSDSDELELTLGNKKQMKNERKGAGKTLCGEACCRSAKDVTNLGKSTVFMSNEDASAISSFICQTHITNSTCMPSMHLPARPYMTSTGRTRRETIHWPFIHHPDADDAERSHESSSLDFGWHEFGGHFSTDIVNQETQPTSNNLRGFDLNIAQFESFPEISQNEVNLPSSASSSTVPSGIANWPHADSIATPALRELSNKSLEETSDVLQTSDKNSVSVQSQAKEAEFLMHGYGSCLYSRQTSTGKMELAGCAGNGNKDIPLTVRSNYEYIADTNGSQKAGISDSSDGNGLTRTEEYPSFSLSGLYQSGNHAAEKSFEFPGCYIQSERKSIKTKSIVDEKGCKLGPSIEISNVPQESSAYSELKQSNSDKQLNCEKCEEDTVSSSRCTNLTSVEGAISVPLEELQDEHNGADPMGEKLEQPERNKECSRNNAEVDGHSVPSINDSFQANEITPVATEKCTGKQELVTDADDRVVLLDKPFSSSELAEEILEKKEKHAAEVDSPAWGAAESLIHISLRTTSTSDEVANIGKLEMEKEERSDQPQNSSDSFGSIVLMLTETATDVFSPPARLTEEETENGKCRFKLRKGRGLRDFQRDVLPGLVSLSRHEICEDLRTIAEAVRLHDLSYACRRLSRGNWFTPVRNKRSRPSYAGKRQ